MSYPKRIIKNSHITAEIALPHEYKSYYRGRRFEWSGNILNMVCHGKVIFSPWTEYITPENHESVAGPMEEFCSGQDDKVGGPGLSEAKPGDPWLKIGVGVLEKTATEPFLFSEIHPLIEGGEWSWESGEDWISFTHKLDYPAKAWGYVYKKTISLKDSRFILDHELINTGKETLDFMQYNHNFFTLGNCPAGPDWKLTFPFDVKGSKHFDYYHIEGNTVEYTKPLEGGEMVYLSGDFGHRGYSFIVENSRDNIKVSVNSDSPLEVLKFWSIPSTVCPEPYIRKICKMGESVNWQLTYSIEIN